jgi:hypothetical protein
MNSTRSLFGSVDSWRGPDAWIAVFEFEAHFDASGAVDSTEVLTLSGLVAAKGRWDSFMPVWTRAMERGGAKGKILHMRELVPGQEQFQGWDEPEAKKHLLRKLFPIVRSHITYGVSVSVPVRGFTSTIGALPADHDRDRLNAMDFCLQSCMQFIRRRLDVSKERPVTFIFEQDEAQEPNIQRQFYHLRREMVRLHQIEHVEAFPEIRFVPKGPPPLQAADMIAYSSFQWALGQLGLDGQASRNLADLRPFLREMLWSVVGKLCSEAHKKCDFGMVSERLLAMHRDSLEAVRDRILAGDEATWCQMNESFQKADKEMQRARDKAARAKRATSDVQEP